jgi:hypothetical protein
MISRRQITRVSTADIKCVHGWGEPPQYGLLHTEGLQQEASSLVLEYLSALTKKNGKLLHLNTCQKRFKSHSHFTCPLA